MRRNALFVASARGRRLNLGSQPSTAVGGLLLVRFNIRKVEVTGRVALIQLGRKSPGGSARMIGSKSPRTVVDSPRTVPKITAGIASSTVSESSGLLIWVNLGPRSKQDLHLGRVVFLGKKSVSWACEGIARMPSINAIRRGEKLYNCLEINAFF